MIDFVHLNWISYKKRKPKTDGIYLYLLKDKKTGEPLVMSIGYFDEALIDAMYLETYEIIAWADQKSIAFDCNPEHYHECGKKDCNMSNDCSTCHKTVKLEYAKWLDWFI